MSQTCTNSYFISHMMVSSGAASSQWHMVLVDSTFQMDCSRMITQEHINPNSIIGSCEFAVSVDKENAAILLAQDAVTFPKAAHRFKDVAGLVLFSSQNIGVAYLGTDMINNLFRSTDEGHDLVMRPGADRAIFGL